MLKHSFLNDNTIMDRIRRAVREYRTPVLAMGAFCIFSILLTDSTCVMRTTTGLPCPGCGMTRATFALLRLDWTAAFIYNPMVFLFWPCLMIWLLLVIFKKTTFKKSTPFFLSFGVCMFLVYIVRMILFFPRVEPMVYDFHSVLGRLIVLIQAVFL